MVPMFLQLLTAVPLGKILATADGDYYCSYLCKTAPDRMVDLSWGGSRFLAHLSAIYGLLRGKQKYR